MRRHHFGLTLVLTLLVAGLTANCGDSLTEVSGPDGRAQARPTVAFATADNGAGLSITTDKDDYSPGDTVWFTGAGWTPGDTLDIVLTDSTDTHNWTVGIDANGGFRDSTYVVDTGDLGVTFTLTATSRATGESLTVNFTDGNIRAKAAPVGVQFVLNRRTYAGGGCTGTETNLGDVTVGSSSFGAVATAGGTNQPVSAKLTAAATSTLGATFGAWTSSSPFSIVGGDPKVICVSGGGGNFDYLATYIAAPDLTLSKTMSGTFSVGNPGGTYTITVSNSGTASADGSLGLTVKDTLPAGLTFSSGGSANGWQACSASSQVVTCNLATGQVIDPGSSKSFPVVVNVAVGACPSVTNRAWVGGGGEPVASNGNNGSGDVATSISSGCPSANQPPVLGSIGDKTVAEETQLAFTATATDENVSTLVFSLANPATGTFPLGATINGSSGAFTWTPTEAQGPGTYRVKIVVTDAGSLSDEEEIEIAVTEVNLPPVLGAIGPKTVDEMTALTFTATATDPDILAGGAKNGLTFSLVNGTDAVPTGAIINGLSGAFSWTPTEAQGPGVYEFKVRVTDDGTNPAALFDEEEITVTVNEVNRPPVLGSIGNKTVNEGSLLTFTATATDPDIPANTLTFSLETGGNADLASASINPATGAFTWTPADDNPTGTPSDNYDLKVVVTDNGVNPDNLTDDEQITVTVNNVAPTITGINLDPNTAGYVYPVTSQPKVMAVWSDPGADSHTCTYSIKDMVLNSIVSTGLTCGTAMDAPGAGLYTVQVTVTDDDTGQDVAIFPTDGLLIVIYDPTAGFVTGGGWINSPAGACNYAACTPSTIGKATFGFVSKYLKGATVPTGNTEFQFHAGGLNFKSSSYEWLVVNGNSGRAQYKGVGTVNGGGSFGFILTAYDGSTDRFRIKIWDVGTSDIIYDNQMGQLDSGFQATDLGGGSIIIHVPKK